MSKKRYFDTNFWSDTWVDGLSHSEKLFFIYLITNDRTSIAGVYEMPVKRMVSETDFSKAEISQMFKRMQNKVRYIDGWVVLRNSIKSQNYKNEKIRLGIKSILETCPIELLQYISIPVDIGVSIERSEPEPNQQRLFDDPSMSHDESSMSHDKYNIIKYNINSNSNAPDKPDAKDSNKFEKTVETPQQKRQYALAMEKEREQQERVAASRSRSGSGLTKFQETKERLKRGEK